MSAQQRLVGEAYGVCFAVEGTANALAAVEPDLPYGWRRSARDPQRTWRIAATERAGAGAAQASADGEELATGDSPESLARIVASDLELWVAEHARGLVFVHAGVVAVQGRAVLLPGLSRAGKSTLVAALVRAGAQYYSDEYAPIDAGGLVHPYRRVPRQRPDSPAAHWSLDLAGDDEPPPLPVTLVAVVRYADGAGLELVETHSAAIVLALLANTVPALGRSVEALDALTVAVTGAHRLHGVRGEAEAAAPALLQRVLGTVDTPLRAAMSRNAQ